MTEFHNVKFSFKRPVSLFFITSLLVSHLTDGVAGEGSDCPRPGSDPLGLSRVDCLPGSSSPTVEECTQRACCWDDGDPQLFQNNLAPKCFLSKTYGYYADSEVVEIDGGIWQATLRRYETPSWFGGDVDKVAVTVEEQTNRRLRIKIYDPENSRFEVPYVKIRRQSEQPAKPLYKVEFQEKPFAIKVSRRSNGKVIFDSSFGALIFADQYLQISTRLASSTLYGLGEHLHTSFKHDLNWKTWPIHAAGKHPTGPDAKNLYGSHPVYLNLEDEGNANMLLLFNQHAMEVVLQPTPAVTFRTIGGILDFYLFLGEWDEQPDLSGVPGMFTDDADTSSQQCDDMDGIGECGEYFPLWRATPPVRAIQEYLLAIGLPVMPPYWSLGFMLSKWNYQDSENLRRVIQRNRDLGIPVEVMWGDVDYMVSAQTFTINKEKYPDLQAIVQDLHDHGQKYVAIHDPGIKICPAGEYRAYDEGNNLDIWVKDAKGEVLQGEVWPGDCVFADFTKDVTHEWWTSHSKSFHENQLKFDGFWIDMNEPSTFKHGSSKGCQENRWNNPPYVPKVTGEVLWNRTFCMDAQQDAGRHYDVHSLYGHSMINATARASRAIFGEDHRSLIVSRSTFVGSGHLAGKWLGDNNASYLDMKWSITGMLEFNMFGFPYVGADICGFFSNTTEELCQRWLQLGAFYPMSRSHCDNVSMPQDPAAFSEQLVESTRHVLQTRYRLLPYLYTLFHLAHTTGTPVVRPLAFEFPRDQNTWGIDRQFLWGPAFLVTPVLTQGALSVRGYFPKARWYYFHSGEELEEVGEWRTLVAPKNTINLHVRGGFVLPLQAPAITTQESRKKPMSLIVAMNEHGESQGVLFWDDGETRDSYQKMEARVVYFYAVKNELVIYSRDSEGSYDPGLHIESISVYGVTRDIDPENIHLATKGKKSEHLRPSHGQVSWDGKRKILRLRKLHLSLTVNHYISWENRHRL